MHMFKTTEQAIVGSFNVEWQIKVCDPLGLRTEVALIPSDVFWPGAGLCCCQGTAAVCRL